MQFRKYEFNTPQEWITLKNTLEFDDKRHALTGEIIERHPKSCAIVELGNIILTPGTYDAQGNQITNPVYSTKTSVDILWVEDTIPSAFTQYEVWPAGVGCHTFSGMEGLYQEEYNKRK
jgi:hypothetical protein